MSEKTKKPIFKRWWFWAIIVIIAIGALGSRGDKEAQTDKATANVELAEKETKQEEVIDITITGADLAKAFEDNEVKAKKDYTGKRAEITGTVQDIGEMFGQTYIVLESQEEFSITNVQCFFKDEKEIDKIATLEKGNEVTIIGTIGEKSINVSVNDCKFK